MLPPGPDTEVLPGEEERERKTPEPVESEARASQGRAEPCRTGSTRKRYSLDFFKYLHVLINIWQKRMHLCTCKMRPVKMSPVEQDTAVLNKARDQDRRQISGLVHQMHETDKTARLQPKWVCSCEIIFHVCRTACPCLGLNKLN